MTSQDVAATAGPSPGAPGDRASNGSVLDVRHVSASYGPYRALFDVSFEIPAGGVLALIGSNGAGKSTVARTITGLVTASEGTVSFQGTDVTRMPAWRIARLGVAHVVEGRGIFSSLSVEENLALAFRQRGGRRSVSDNLERAYGEFSILKDRRKQVAGTLSGGQQRVLSLAKVLVVPPKLLVADELSLGLAPIVVDAVYEALEAINRSGTAMLVVEQQVDRVLKLANKALVLDRGRVVYDGGPSGAAAAIDQLVTRRDEAGARAAALAEESEGIPDTAEIAEAVTGEPAGAPGPDIGAASPGDEPDPAT